MSTTIQTSNTVVEVHEAADLGATRRAVRDAAVQVRLPQAQTEAAQLAVTELASNIVRHAGGDGYVLVRALPNAGGMEVLAVDRGPGIDERATAVAGVCRTVGFADGLGVGLGSVHRLAMDFDLYARRSRGTVVLARFWQHTAPAPASALSSGGVSLAVVPLEANGDAWAIAREDEGEDGDEAFLLVDGLGHGANAHRAADVASSIFAAEYHGDLALWFERANAGMLQTRGGVAAIARVDRTRNVVQFAGVGNIAGRVVTGAGSRGLISRPGLIGTEIRPPRPHVVEVPWPAGSLMLLWSDGLTSRVMLDDYPGLIHHDPAVIAAVLHRDFGKGRDDATIIVVQDRSSGR